MMSFRFMHSLTVYPFFSHRSWELRINPDDYRSASQRETRELADENKSVHVSRYSRIRGFPIFRYRDDSWKRLQVDVNDRRSDAGRIWDSCDISQYSKTDSGDAKQRYQYGGYSSRILNAAWHGHICVSPLAGFVMAAGFHLKCDVKSPRCPAIKLLSRLASCRRLYLGWRVRGRARSPNGRAIELSTRQLRKLTVLLYNKQSACAATAGKHREYKDHLISFFSLSFSFFLLSSRMKESSRIRDEGRATVCASCDIISIDFCLAPEVDSRGRRDGC